MWRTWFAAAAPISISTSEMLAGSRVFWWTSAIAVATGWWLAFEFSVFSLLALLPERDWRPVELAGWGFIIVAMTLASIISVLSLFRLSQKRRSEWLSPRVQLLAFTVVLIQLVVFVVLGVEPIMVSGALGAVELSVVLVGAFQLVGLGAGIRALRTASA